MRVLGSASGGGKHLVWMAGGEWLVRVPSCNDFPEATEGEEFALWHVPSGKMHRVALPPGHKPRFVAAHPDGRRLATADFNGPYRRPVTPAHLWTLADGTLVPEAFPLE